MCARMVHATTAPHTAALPLAQLVLRCVLAWSMLLLLHTLLLSHWPNLFSDVCSHGPCYYCSTHCCSPTGPTCSQMCARMVHATTAPHTAALPLAQLVLRCVLTWPMLLLLHTLLLSHWPN